LETATISLTKKAPVKSRKLLGAGAVTATLSIGVSVHYRSSKSAATSRGFPLCGHTRTALLPFISCHNHLHAYRPNVRFLPISSSTPLDPGVAGERNRLAKLRWIRLASSLSICCRRLQRGLQRENNLNRSNSYFVLATQHGHILHVKGEPGRSKPDQIDGNSKEGANHFFWRHRGDGDGLLICGIGIECRRKRILIVNSYA